MSEAPDRESKTEEATPRKLEQAREKGDGVKTMDLGSFATLATAAGVCVIAGGWLSRNMAAQLTPFFQHPQDMTLEGHGGIEIFRYALMAGAPALIIVMFATGLAGATASLLQTGLRLTPENSSPIGRNSLSARAWSGCSGPTG